MIEFEFNQKTPNQMDETHEVQIEFEFMEEDDGQEKFEFSKVGLNELCGLPRQTKTARSGLTT